MPRNRKLRDKQAETEALESPINPTGTGEDRAVKELVTGEFAAMPEREAVDLQLALQSIIRGQASILSRMEADDEAAKREFARIMERMERYEKSAREWEEDRVKFLERVDALADKVRAVGDKKDRIIADGVKQYQQAVTEAKAEAAVESLKFAEQLARMPKVTVTSPGQLVLTRIGGQQSSRLIPEVIRIKDKQWVLQPGVPTEVPQAVADRFFAIQRSKMENQQRQQALQSDLTADQLNKKWNEINKTYKSPAVIAGV